jgi:hypothetical protein
MKYPDILKQDFISQIVSLSKKRKNKIICGWLLGYFFDRRGRSGSGFADSDARLARHCQTD